MIRAQALSSDRIRGVETGGCPHTAIREDASVNLAAIEDLKQRFPKLDLILLESGGDNLAATFSPELVDLTIYVIDVCMGGDIPRKKGPALMKSDMLVVNKIELAPHVNVDIEQLHIPTFCVHVIRDCPCWDIRGKVGGNHDIALSSERVPLVAKRVIH